MRKDWFEFWYAPRTSAPLGLFRMVFGLGILISALLIAPPALYTWFSQDGPVPLGAERIYWGHQALFDLLGDVTDLHVIWAAWFAYLICAFLVTIGLYTRVATVGTFLLMLSFHNRDPIVLNGGDTIERCILFLLMFAPAQASCSVDRLIAIAKGRDPGGEPILVEPWVQRLIQLQISLLYLCAFMSKATGSLWISGVAVYYPLHFVEAMRFPVPFRNTMWIINLMTWGTLVIEGGLAFLIWSRPLRPYVLAAGVMLHLGIEYAINIPLFSWYMISSYLTFTPNAWIRQWVDVLSRSFGIYRLRVQCSADGVAPERFLSVIRRMDALHLLTIEETPGDASSLRVFGRGWEGDNALGLRRILLCLPALWPAAPFLFVPGALKLLSRFLAAVEKPAPEPVASQPPAVAA